jgi:hypothetical protein
MLIPSSFGTGAVGKADASNANERIIHFMVTAVGDVG